MLCGRRYVLPVSSCEKLSRVQTYFYRCVQIACMVTTEVREFWFDTRLGQSSTEVREFWFDTRLGQSFFQAKFCLSTVIHLRNVVGSFGGKVMYWREETRKYILVDRYITDRHNMTLVVIMTLNFKTNEQKKKTSNVVFNPLTNNTCFYPVAFRKHCGKGENVAKQYYLPLSKTKHLSDIYSEVCKCFEFGGVQHFVVWLKGKPLRTFYHLLSCSTVTSLVEKELDLSYRFSERQSDGDENRWEFTIKKFRHEDVPWNRAQYI